MLETPFGKINILVDGVAIHYEAKPFDFIKPPVKDKPIAGCYRIHIPVENYHSIQCVSGRYFPKLPLWNRSLCRGERIMSVCIFIAADVPLQEVAPTKEYPVHIDLDKGTIDDSGADDNFFLFSFPDVQDYTDKKYGVYLEWRYTDGRAEQILKYIREALKETESVELWHVWLMDYYEYEDRPVIHKRKISINEMTIKDIYELDHAEIWNSPDKNIPSRPSFYRLIITR